MSKLKVILIKSLIGRLKSHKATVLSLGLKKINSNIILDNNTIVRGMINKVNYLLKVEEV